MSLATDIRTHLLADPQIVAIVGDRIHEGHVPEFDPEVDDLIPAYIWLSKSGSEEDGCLDDGPGIAADRVTFDLDCFAPTKTDADTLADLVRAALHNRHKAGPVAGTTVRAVFVTDQSDDYIPQGLMSDEGQSVISYSLEVVP